MSEFIDKSYEKIPRPEESELLGEARERMMVINYIEDLAKNCSNSDIAKIYRKLSESISNCEHY